MIRMIGHYNYNFIIVHSSINATAVSLLNQWIFFRIDYPHTIRNNTSGSIDAQTMCLGPVI